jgi:hypothetical protein
MDPVRAVRPADAKGTRSGWRIGAAQTTGGNDEIADRNELIPQLQKSAKEDAPAGYQYVDAQPLPVLGSSPPGFVAQYTDGTRTRSVAFIVLDVSQARMAKAARTADQRDPRGPKAARPRRTRPPASLRRRCSVVSDRISDKLRRARIRQSPLQVRSGGQPHVAALIPLMGGYGVMMRLLNEFEAVIVVAGDASRYSHPSQDALVMDAVARTHREAGLGDLIGPLESTGSSARATWHTLADHSQRRRASASRFEINVLSSPPLRRASSPVRRRMVPTIAS